MSLAPGVQRYVDRAADEVATRKNAVAAMRRCRFDTIAVHGLYTLQEALEHNQGSIIEPIYMATSQGYRDADEMEAALAYLVPDLVLLAHRQPVALLPREWTLALLEGYGFDVETSCCATSSGMAAIDSATEPFLVRDPGGREHEPVNFVSTCQVYGGTFQQFSVRQGSGEGERVPLGAPPRPASTSGRRRSTATPASSTASCPPTPDSRLLRPRGGGGAGAQSRHPADRRHHGGDAGAAAAAGARRRHRRPVGDQEHDVLRVRHRRRGDLAPQHRDQHPERRAARRLRQLRQVPPEPRQRPQHLADARGALAQRPAHAARQDGPDVSRTTMQVAEFLAGHPDDRAGSTTSACRSTRCTRSRSRYLFLVDAEHDAQYGRR